MPAPSASCELEPGRRILVTGAGGGIGLAMISALLSRGVQVIALDLPRILEKGALPSQVATYGCDLTHEAEVKATFAEIGARWSGLDGLVALAGFSLASAPLEQTGYDDWSGVLDGNLDTTYLPLRAALPLLRNGNRPSVVTMASGLAVKAAPGYGAYGVAKAGVIALTKLIAAEEAPLIRANVVAPAAVDTPFLRGGTAHGEPGQAIRLDLDAYVKTIPLGRLADPLDVVGPILFLLSPAAGYITGQTLHINGGSLMP